MVLTLGLMLTLSVAAHAADPDDDDGDGLGESSGDCDDRDASVYPGAPEICDGKDQDCDGRIDEGTGCFDDDGDGYSEDEGDCSDTDRAVNPGAREVYNFIDDDCDGLIDEGTEGYDDDEDGFTELEGDCDDADPLRAPDQPDYCRDGLDSDCDGLVDGPDCIEDPADGCDPGLRVRLSASRFTGGPGESVTLDATPAFDDAALTPIFSWFVEDGSLDFTDTPDTTWQLPAQEGPVLVIATVSDPCGFSAVDELTIDVLDDPLSRRGAYAGGCRSERSTAALLLPLPLLSLSLLRSRRRRSSPLT